MKYSAAGVRTSLCAALATSNGPDRPSDSSRIVYLVTLDRLCKLSRYGTALQMDSSWNRWVRRQRLHAHAPRSCTCPLLGTLSESLVSWHSLSLGGLCCGTSIYSRVARFKPVDTWYHWHLRGSPKLPCDSHGLNLPNHGLLTAQALRVVPYTDALRRSLRLWA
jgi:hypothetical protein